MLAAITAFRSDTPDDDEDDDGHAQQRAAGRSMLATTAAAATATAAPSGISQAQAAAAAAATAAAVARLPATPRLRTRLFAAELLLSLFAAVGPDARHKHPRPKYGDVTGSDGQTGGGWASICICVAVGGDLHWWPGTSGAQHVAAPEHGYTLSSTPHGVTQAASSPACPCCCCCCCRLFGEPLADPG
jgi:hypothetical protein